MRSLRGGAAAPGGGRFWPTRTQRPSTSAPGRCGSVRRPRTRCPAACCRSTRSGSIPWVIVISSFIWAADPSAKRPSAVRASFGEPADLLRIGEAHLPAAPCSWRGSCSKARSPGIEITGQSRDSLIRRINSLMTRFNSLLGRNKFPVPMRRELARKPLNLMLDSEPVVALGGPDEQNSRYSLADGTDPSEILGHPFLPIWSRVDKGACRARAIEAPLRYSLSGGDDNCNLADCRERICPGGSIAG